MSGKLKVKMVKEQVERLKELIKGVQEANDRLESFKKELEATAPVKVGDVVEVSGYSFNGKKMLVGRVHLKDWWGRTRWEWAAAGKVIKKDGTPGEQTAETTWEIEL